MHQADIAPALAFEDIEGHHPVLPWREDELRLALAALSDLARALTPAPAGLPALADDESAFHWNAAGVSLVPHQLAGFMYSAEYGTPGSSLANFYQIGFTYPMKDITLAANWVRLAIGDLVHTPDLTNISVTDERAQWALGEGVVGPIQFPHGRYRSGAAVRLPCSVGPSLRRRR